MADKKEIILQMREGNTLYRKQEYRQAATHFEQVVELDPNNAEARYRLGQCYAVTGERGKARAQVPILRTLNNSYAIKLSAMLN